MRTKAWIATTVLWIAAAGPALAGTVFEMTSTDAGSGKSESTRMTIDGNRLRMDAGIDEETGQAETSMVFRGDREEVIYLDHAKSEATVIDRKTVEEFADRIREARERMEQAMANVPPEQRAMMEQMMQGRMQGMMSAPAPTEVRKTSETGTTNGFPWVKYEVLREGEKIREYLVTDWSRLEIEASTFDVFREMAKFLESFTKGMGAKTDYGQNPFDEAGDLDGFPVVTREFAGGKLRGETELKSVSTEDVDGALFENPGYEERKLEAPAMR